MKIKAIIGIGNPGLEYKDTYHNAGVLFVEHIQKTENFASNFKFFKSDVFMNESGKFVLEKVKNSNLNIEDVAIAHDDSDIEIGQYKIDFDRGSAGHNGIINIISNLKSQKFSRIRIGIRTNSKVRKKAQEFVLNKISKQNKELLIKVFEKIEIDLNDFV